MLIIIKVYSILDVNADSDFWDGTYANTGAASVTVSGATVSHPFGEADNNWGTAFSKESYNSGSAEFDLQLTSFEDSPNSIDIHIGFIPDNCAANSATIHANVAHPPQAGGLWISHGSCRGYSYIMPGGTYGYDGASFLSDPNYGASWTTGDTIKAVIDFDAQTIEFFKNGESQGVAFTSISGTFRFAVSIVTGATLELISWTKSTTFVTSSSARITAHCDDILTVTVSDDMGSTWTQVAYESNWVTPVEFSLTVAEQTILKFSCQDQGVIGGFIATILYLGATYVTTNPIQNGFFQLLSSSDGNIASLQYSGKTSAPWHIDTQRIDANAFWIWNGELENNMVFQFDFSEITKAPTKSPTASPTGSAHTHYDGFCADYQCGVADASGSNSDGSDCYCDDLCSDPDYDDCCQS